MTSSCVVLILCIEFSFFVVAIIQGFFLLEFFLEVAQLTPYEVCLRKTFQLFAPLSLSLQNLLLFVCKQRTQCILIIPLFLVFFLCVKSTDNFVLCTDVGMKAGLIMVIGQLFDGLTDPVVGRLSDLTVTRFGRRRYKSSCLWSGLNSS